MRVLFSFRKVIYIAYTILATEKQDRKIASLSSLYFINTMYKNPGGGTRPMQTLSFSGLGTHLFVKVPRPGDS